MASKVLEIEKALESYDTENQLGSLGSLGAKKRLFNPRKKKKKSPALGKLAL